MIGWVGEGGLLTLPAPFVCAQPTIIEHDGHAGYICCGRLLCREAEAWVPHVLTPAVPGCTPVAVTLKDHVHGPGCGHPTVPHGDHVDYLVGTTSILAAAAAVHTGSALDCVMTPHRSTDTILLFNVCFDSAVESCHQLCKAPKRAQVDDELHHIGNTVAGACCSAACIGDASGAVVSHGRITVR